MPLNAATAPLYVQRLARGRRLHKCFAQPSQRLITAGEKSESFTDRLGHPMKLTPREGVAMVLNAHVVDWYDHSLEADHWVALGDVSPIDAAMLLCRFNPNDETYENVKLITSDELKPEHLVRLVQRFTDIRESDPMPRTLRDWHQRAKELGLKYHSWIDGYMKPTTPPAASAQTETFKAGEELDYSLMATRKQLLDAFEKWGYMRAAWFDDLKSRRWLLHARRIKGRGQRGHVIEPMFCPLAVMNGLIEKGLKNKRLPPDAAWRTLEHKFPKVYALYEHCDPRSERTGN